MNIKKCLSCGNINTFHVIEKVYYKYFYNEKGLLYDSQQIGTFGLLSVHCAECDSTLVEGNFL